MEAKAGASLEVRDLVYVGVFAALLAIFSWISIPTVVPFTLQTFGVFLALTVLGGKRGTLAILVYILLGAMGLPVFSGFTGGFGRLLGTTGGYIVGFLATGLLYIIYEDISGRANRGESLRGSRAASEGTDCKTSPEAGCGETSQAVPGASGREERKRSARKSLAGEALTLFLGLLLCYVIGTAWFMFVYIGQNGAVSLGTVLGWCVLPFIIPDIGKLILALLVGRRIRRTGVLR